MTKKKKALRSATVTPKKVFFISLGCPKNTVDTEVMAGILLTHGYHLTFEMENADVVVVNTCAFIPEAREEAAQTIEEVVEWKQERPEHRRLVVAGCLVQYDRLEQKYKNAYPEVDLWCGVDWLTQLPGLLQEKGNGEVFVSADPHYLYDETTPRLQFTADHVAYLKIADGCNNRCTYCSIPNIRGNLRSRSIESVVSEAKVLIANGVKELVLIAQDITAFGADLNDGSNFAQLLRALDALEGDFKLRLLYTHPAHFTDEAIEAFAAAKHVYHYLDIPLQHINDTILKRMGRRVGRAEVEMVLAKLRKAVPDLVLRTTFITGFPGEDEKAYQELKEFISAFKFERLGVFAYSPEPNTPAAEFPDQVALDVAEARAMELMEIQKEISRAFNATWIGREIEVLIDGADGNSLIARGQADAPEIDNAVLIEDLSGELEPGQWCRVRIIGGDEYDLEAELVK